jgi:homoserine dehydrogenase
MRPVTIGLLGCGTVGQGFLRLLKEERFRDLQVGRILVRDLQKERPGVDAALLTTNALEVIDDCDLVVELIGGVHSAGAYVRRALRSGRDVVTANKALLAGAGRELFALARDCGVQIGFEASVCGGIPVIRAIERGLAGDSIESITGIVNGTCNYILTRMEENGLDFASALRLAQQRGLAEADATLDVSGADALQKLQILAELSFGTSSHVRIRVHGIDDIEREEIEQARVRGAA